MVANPHLRAQFGKRRDLDQPGNDSCPSSSPQWQGPMWKPQARANAAPRAPLFALNALDDDCNVKNSPDLLQVIIGNWSNISQSEREKCAQIVARSKDVSNQSLELESSERTSTQSSTDMSPRHKLKGKGKPKIKPTVQIKGATKKRKGYVEEDTEESEWESMPKPRDLPRISFRIDDKDEVEAFLYTRFMQIQQSAGKVIAKAWIKAICPKKQANYPYVDCNPRPDQPRRRPRFAGPPRVPSFWPDLEICRHKEPDHLDKNERTYLLVHLLRIYWGPKEWKQSNGENCEIPGYITSECWVEFLKDVFPPEKLSEVPGCSTEKNNQRMKYLDDIYRVALAEQEYRQGGNDGRIMFTFTGDVKLMHPRDVRPRRPRSNHTANNGGDGQSDAADRTSTPASVEPTTATSISPLGVSIRSSISEEGCGGLDEAISEQGFASEGGNEKRTAPETNTARSDVVMPSSPWTMLGRTNSTPNLMRPSTMPAPQMFKAETPTGDLQHVNGGYFGSVPQYNNTQTQMGLDNPSVWNETFPSYMGFSPTGFASDSVSVNTGMDTVYRHSVGSLDPMLGGLSLRSPTQGAEGPFFGQESKLYTPISPVVHPMMYTTASPQNAINAELMMGPRQNYEGEQRPRQFGYTGQAPNMFGQEQPRDMNYVAQMAGAERGFTGQNHQHNMMPGYRQF